jgi:methyl-accepting chemotaxis protein
MFESSEEKCPCPEIQDRIDLLQWAGSQMKVIPNLPKGKLRDQISRELSQLVNGKQGEFESLRSHFQRLLSQEGLMNEVRRKADDISMSSKRPTSQDLKAISELVRKLSNELAEIKRELFTL